MPQWLALRLGDGRFDAVPYPWRDMDGFVVDWSAVYIILASSVTTTDDIRVVTADSRLEAANMAETMFEECPIEPEPVPADNENESIEAAMSNAGGSVRTAAAILGIKETALHLRLNRPELSHWRRIKYERAGYLAYGLRV